MATASETLQRIRESIYALFPNESEEIIALSDGGNGMPIGYDHVPMLAELAGVQLSNEILDDLTTSYVLMYAFYVLLDHGIDDSPPLEQRLNLVYLAHMLAGSLQLIAGVCHSYQCEVRDAVDNVVRKETSANARAMRLEYALYLSPTEIKSDLDHESVVGRSSTPILFYQIITLLGLKKSRRDVVDLLSEYIQCLQMADDLADWRSDLNRGMYTATIRAVFASQHGVLSEKQVEDYMYFNGYYEQRVSEIIARLDNLSVKMKAPGSPSGTLLLRRIAEQRASMYDALKDHLQIKLAYAR